MAPDSVPGRECAFADRGTLVQSSYCHTYKSMAPVEVPVDTFARFCVIREPHKPLLDASG